MRTGDFFDCIVSKLTDKPNTTEYHLHEEDLLSTELWLLTTIIRQMTRKGVEIQNDVGIIVK